MLPGYLPATYQAPKYNCNLALHDSLGGPSQTCGLFNCQARSNYAGSRAVAQVPPKIQLQHNNNNKLPRRPGSLCAASRKQQGLSGCQDTKLARVGCWGKVAPRNQLTQLNGASQPKDRWMAHQAYAAWHAAVQLP